MSLSRLSLLAPLFFTLACPKPAPPQPVDACGNKCTDGQVCVASECRDKVCEPFSRECVDTATLATCNGNGTSTLEEACPSGSACLAGSCAPTVCVPDTYFCGSDGERKLCQSGGLGFDSAPCDSGQGCSGSGECVAQICTPGEVVECVTEGERAIKRCDLSGTQILDDQCSSGELCIGDACQALVCTPGKKYCVDGQTLADCNATGTGPAATTTCDSGVGAECMVDPENPDGALCATACDVAAATKSYIACDYRFAVTDNNIAGDLAGGSDAFPAAVVIANTSDEAATLSLYNASGAAVALPAVRNVADRNTMGGTGTPQSVHSKIVAGGSPTNIDGQTADTISLPAGGIATLLLPDDAVHGSGVFQQGYHLTSSLPVSAYLFNPICCNYAYTNDASLLIPTTAWRQAYFVVSGPHRTWSAGLLGMQQSEASSSPAGLAVVASQDDTRIAIRRRAGQPASDFKIENGLPNFGNDSNYPEELRVTLQAGDVFQLETAYKTSAPDPTGVLVASDKPIGVFGLHECAYVPEKKQACDHMEEMLLPIETWGTDYIAAMPQLRNTDTAAASNGERIYYRFVSSADANRIQVLPKPTDVAAAHAASSTTCPMASDGSFVLGEGEYCEFGSRDSFKVTAAEPILVGAIFAGQEATGLESLTGPAHAGDPALSQLVPIDQYRKNYSFLTPDTYYADYVTVVYNSNSAILLDEVDVSTLMTCSGAPGSTCVSEAPVAIAGTAFNHMSIRLSRGAHTMRSVMASNAAQEGDRFGIFNYGYDDYVSYAYPGGLDLVQTGTYQNMPAFP